MTVKEELELLVKDVEGAAHEAEEIGERAECRAWQSVAYRIRHAANQLPD